MNTTTKAFLLTLTVVCLLVGLFPATVMAEQVVDDTVTIGVEFDNELNSRMPDSIKESFSYISIGVSKFYGNETARYLAKINVSSLDSSREITSAVFKIDRVSSTWDRDNLYYLCQVDEPWNTYNVTWNNQPNFGGTGVEGVYTSYGIFEFDFTDLSQSWVSDPDSNNGFLIMKTYETGIENELNAGEANRGQFVSTNYSTRGGETRPYLEISYATQEIEPILYWIEPYNIYTTFDLGEERVVSGVRAIVYPDKVETSTDGISWTAVAYTVASNPEDFVEILFDEQTSAQYIRVYETRSYKSVLVEMEPLLGDFNGDGQVCRTDLNILLQYRNQPASEFPEGDLDGDGRITILDARNLVLICTNPRCACN